MAELLPGASSVQAQAAMAALAQDWAKMWTRGRTIRLRALQAGPGERQGSVHIQGFIEGASHFPLELELSAAQVRELVTKGLNCRLQG